jgi:parallel beta-helix repeat protein
MNSLLLWLRRIVVGFIGLVLAGLILAIIVPVPRDEVIKPEDYGAGASSISGSVTGLQRAFPPIGQMAGNPSSATKIELGRLLFFDPVLSENNDISCATCHHPDLSFSDGLPQAIGAGGIGLGPSRNGGISLTRNTPSLWNVAYATSFFWDGRVDNLEYQALVPLSHVDEMGVTNTDALEEELRGIDGYVELFSDVFGSGTNSISVENVVRAIASFERTILSMDSPFDSYAAGNEAALSASQLRGLALFRSAATRCFECHSVPTFSTDGFRVIGVPDAEGLPHDSGRASAVGDGVDGAFKVPGLRNVALSAPYMHNGVFGTLEEVVDFYAAGGGRADGIEGIDPFVRGFELNEQERSDLINFLYSLTDESQLAQIPDTLPSGLTAVSPLNNPARSTANEANAAQGSSSTTDRDPVTLIVGEGESLQSVVDGAQSGDTILIPYGVYHERVAVDKNNITIRGIPNAAGDYPVLDGENRLTEAVISSGNNFEISHLAVLNYTDNGVLVEGIQNVHMHHMYVENTGTYGLYPVQSSGILIENSEVIGANDAGIYAGQSMDVVIRNNIVHGNVLGIEVENTVGGEVYGNHAYNNTNGILIILLPQLTSQVSLNTVVYGNLVENNNHVNFALEGTAASLMPVGSGIGLVASDHVEVYGNTIRGNDSAGLGIFNLLIAYDEAEVDIGPRPEHIFIHDNEFNGNGGSPDPFIADMGIPGADILWDVSGWNVHFEEAEGTDIFPPLVPDPNWPDWLFNLYWQALNFAIGLMG